MRYKMSELTAPLALLEEEELDEEDADDRGAANSRQ